MGRYAASRAPGTDASEQTTCAGAGRTKHGKPTGPTRFGEHGSPSDGEIEIKSIFDG